MTGMILHPTAVLLTTDWDGHSYPMVLRSEDFGEPTISQLASMPDGMMGRLLALLRAGAGQEMRCVLTEESSLGPSSLVHHGNRFAEAWTFAFSHWFSGDVRAFGDRVPVEGCCVVNLDRGEFVSIRRGEPSPLPFLLHVPPEHMRRSGEGAWALDSILWARNPPRIDDGFKDVSQVQPDP